MNNAKLLLNKVIEDGTTTPITRHNITIDDMHSDVDRATYMFVMSYAEQNGGKAPSYATVVSSVEGFEYITEVSDSYSWLTEEIKSESAKRGFIKLWESGAIERNLNGMTGAEFVNVWLPAQLGDIQSKTNIRESVGTDLKRDGSLFLEEYYDRKEGRSFKIWKSKFSLINDQISGYFSGNMYTWYARSGRGKSIITAEEAIEAAFQGANVLVWAMEMSRFEWMARAYSTISARLSRTVEMIDGVNYEVGFDSRHMLSGKLEEGYEDGLKMFVDKLAEGGILKGNIILRAADDDDFIKRDVKQLEADIISTKADVVLIDPIYLMDFEQNTSRTAGGDVANTSKRLRRIAGTENVVLHIVTQAEEVKDDEDEEGNREIRPPKRAEIKKTKSVLEDAANTFGIDSLNGEGIIEIGKGRNGGEGTQVHLLFLPNFGIVRQMETGEAVADEFYPF